MTEEYYYLKNNVAYGPFDKSVLLGQINKERLPASILIAKSGDSDWIPAKQVFDLDSIKGVADAQKELPPVPESGTNLYELPMDRWKTTPVRPWRRAFARLVDMIFSLFFIMFSVAFFIETITPSFYQAYNELMDSTFNEMMDLTFGDIFVSLVFIPSTVFFNAIFIAYRGSSLGKFIFGIKVTDHNFLPMGYKKALKREFMVFVRGLALFLGFFALISCFIAYRKLKKKSVTTWDERLNLRIFYRTKFKTA